MNAKGINVIPNLKPGVLPKPPYAKYYEDRNAFIKTADGRTITGAAGGAARDGSRLHRPRGPGGLEAAF